MDLLDIKTDARLVNLRGTGPEVVAQDKEMRLAARALFPSAAREMARYDTWTDEQAAVMLVGFPWPWIESLDQPAHDVSLAFARRVLRLIRSGDGSRRPPMDWLAWAERKGVAVPKSLREAIEAAAPQSLGKGGQKRTRRDAMSREIDEAIRLIDGAPTPTAIMRRLQSFAGREGSCVTERCAEGVLWRDDSGKPQKLTAEALEKRLARRV